MAKVVESKVAGQCHCLFAPRFGRCCISDHLANCRAKVSSVEVPVPEDATFGRGEDMSVGGWREVQQMLGQHRGKESWNDDGARLSVLGRPFLQPAVDLSNRAG